jgi:hypothetical protein
MVQPFDYMHKSGLAGLVLQNYAARPDSSVGNPFSVPNLLRAQPFFTGDLPLALAQIGLNCSSIGLAKIKIAVYDCLSTRDVYPRNLLHDLGEVDLAATGPRMLPAAFTLAAGKLFWLVTNTDGGTGQYTSVASNNEASVPVGLLGTFISGPTTSSTGLSMGLSVARAYAAAPTFPATFPAGAVPIAGASDLVGIILDPA